MSIFLLDTVKKLHIIRIINFMEIEMANVKNAPEGRYFSETGWSDAYPWVVVSSSPSGKTLTLARVDVERDPEWKPIMIAGGFSAHCENQQEQTWLFKSICPMSRKTIRLGKNGWAGGKFHETPKGPFRFYDYNF
jgi:hypothetical protein